ncbi:MAG: hypothetical protein V3T88_08110, partial [Nitrosomonadaceae bacterium]
SVLLFNRPENERLQFIQKEEQGIMWTKIFSSIPLILISAAVISGAVWYVMWHLSKEYKGKK